MAKEKLVSVICCSVCPEMADALRSNVEETIGGMPFELLAFDNRTENLPICEVYNRCAERARGKYLVFVHEDVAFLTEGWGARLTERLDMSGCGVVGFVGDTYKARALTPWQSFMPKNVRCNYVQGRGEGHGKCHFCHNPYNEEFAQVITLDGMLLAVRHDVWEQVRFDADTLRGFHCYDVDFTIAVHVAGYRNYVCLTDCVEHFSVGNYSRAWYDDTVKIHNKWAGRLPISVIPLTSKDIDSFECTATVRALKFLMRSQIAGTYSLGDAFAILRKYPTSDKAYNMLLKYPWYKYVRPAWYRYIKKKH